MSDNHKSLRLGDLLVEKKLITPQQLREAIELQAKRRESQSTEAMELGQILVELGYIDRFQLKANLNWQRRLKATTAVMVFIAPLLTAACGGGGGGSSGGGSGTTTAEPPPSSQVVQTPTNQTSSAQSSAASLPASTNPTETSTQTSASQAPVSSAPLATSSSTSSAATVGGVTVQSSVPASLSSSSQSSAPASSSSSTASSVGGMVNGPVQLYWKVPSARENGDYLDITEIGGYELRYKQKTDANYKTIIINDGFTDAYYFDSLTGDYEFEIATFDVNGVYSNFIPVMPSS